VIKGVIVQRVLWVVLIIMKANFSQTPIFFIENSYWTASKLKIKLRLKGLIVLKQLKNVVFVNILLYTISGLLQYEGSVIKTFFLFLFFCFSLVDLIIYFAILYSRNRWKGFQTDSLISFMNVILTEIWWC